MIPSKNFNKTFIVTVFSLVAALIWKDVITDFIKIIVPPNEQLFYKFLTAVLATVVVLISVSLILRTESEAESIINKLKKNHKRN